jgi:hypothetical protein
MSVQIGQTEEDSEAGTQIRRSIRKRPNAAGRIAAVQGAPQDQAVTTTMRSAAGVTKVAANGGMATRITASGNRKAVITQCAAPHATITTKMSEASVREEGAADGMETRSDSLNLLIGAGRVGAARGPAQARGANTRATTGAVAGTGGGTAIRSGILRPRSGAGRDAAADQTEARPREARMEAMGAAGRAGMAGSGVGSVIPRGIRVRPSAAGSIAGAAREEVASVG